MFERFFGDVGVCVGSLVRFEGVCRFWGMREGRGGVLLGKGMRKKNADLMCVWFVWVYGGFGEGEGD